jgi:carbon storage regulator CsrA
MALVISRKVEEGFTIGDEIIVRIVRKKGGSVRISIDAPKELAIKRIGEFNESDDPCDIGDVDGSALADCDGHSSGTGSGESRDDARPTA